jgi:hypothetical protein
MNLSERLAKVRISSTSKQRILKLAESPDWKDFIQVFNAIHNPKTLHARTGIVSVKIINTDFDIKFVNARKK